MSKNGFKDKKTTITCQNGMSASLPLKSIFTFRAVSFGNSIGLDSFALTRSLRNEQNDSSERTSSRCLAFSEKSFTVCFHTFSSSNIARFAKPTEARDRNISTGTNRT